MSKNTARNLVNLPRVQCLKLKHIFFLGNAFNPNSQDRRTGNFDTDQAYIALRDFHLSAIIGDPIEAPHETPRYHILHMMFEGFQRVCLPLTIAGFAYLLLTNTRVCLSFVNQWQGLFTNKRVCLTFVNQ